jgi:hypothetical protein
MKSAAGAGADTKSKRRSSATVGAATVDPHDQVGETVEEVDSEDNENEDEIAARCVKHVKSHGLGWVLTSTEPAVLPRAFMKTQPYCSIIDPVATAVPANVPAPASHPSNLPDPSHPWQAPLVWGQR